MSGVVSIKSLSSEHALYPNASMLQQSIWENKKIREEARLQDKKQVEKKEEDVNEQIIMRRKKTESYLNQINKEFRNTMRYSNSRLAICSEFRFSINNAVLITRYSFGYHSTRQDTFYRVSYYSTRQDTFHRIGRRQYLYFPYHERKKVVVLDVKRNTDEVYKNQFQNTSHDAEISIEPFMCNTKQQDGDDNDKKSKNASHDHSLSTETSTTEQHDEDNDLSQNVSTDDTLSKIPSMCETVHDDGDNGNKSKNVSDPHKFSIESTSLEHEWELHTEVKRLKEQNSRFLIHIQILEKKLREANTRMENMMGTGSVNDSDTNNALIKVTADGFSDIYNNSWMDAFEELADMNIDDTIIITLLLQLLKAADHHKATVHEDDNGSGEKVQELEHVEKKNFQKQEFKIIGKYVDITPGSPFPTDVFTNTLKYGDTCLEWCLTKTRCLPSVYLEFDVESGSEFNESFYRTYNKTGPVFDYVVWPALFENRHGRLLLKGVAQPK